MVKAGDTLCAACMAVEHHLTAAGCPDAAFDAADLCLLATGEQARMTPLERQLSEAEAARLNEVAIRRAAREPLQYIWGQWPFLNFELKVGKGVLCPRADTEVVVELAAQCLRGVAPMTNAGVVLMQSLPESCKDDINANNAEACAQKPAVLELCGGSGCIGLGIKMFCPSAQVTVLEKSPEALLYLRENAAHALDAFAAAMPKLATSTAATNANGLEQANVDVAAEKRDSTLVPPYVTVVEGDLFTYHNSLPDAAFDLLISNPPYLTEQEMTELQPEVACEPAMALVAGADGLDFYRAIASDYQRVVKPGGFLVLEIGCAQAVDVSALLAAAGWEEITCHKDYGQNDRCIIARRP